MKTYHEMLSEKPYLPAVFALLVIVLTAVGTFWIGERGEKLSREAATESERTEAPDPFKNIALSAQAAYVYDALTGEVLYEKNAEMQLPLASITKLMTAVVASERLSADAEIMIEPQDLEPSGDSGLTLGESWPFRELLSFTLLVSSNDGAAALAHASTKHVLPQSAGTDPFVELMNQKAKELGLHQTYFLNPTGLDTNGHISGGYGSARDASELLRYALLKAPHAFESTRNTLGEYVSPSGDRYTAENTNEIADRIPGLIASKTGFTDLAGGNLVVAFDAGIRHPIIISVLGSTKENRFSDVEALVAAALETLQIAGIYAARP